MSEEKRNLFERMAKLMGCQYISNLRFLNSKEKLRLAGILSLIPESDATLFQWNDALEYLGGSDRRHTEAATARAALIAFLSKEER